MITPNKNINKDLSMIIMNEASKLDKRKSLQVFHGAARLVQPGSATTNPQNGHTAARRAFNADITKEMKNNV
jgi:hypothetical protein